MEKKQRLRACGSGGGDEGSGAVLPHDLVVEEVLTRLPAKSLMRFKCVSKLWCSAFSDPSFVKAHLARSPSRPGLLMLRPHLNLNLGVFHASLPNPISSGSTSNSKGGGGCGGELVFLHQFTVSQHKHEHNEVVKKEFVIYSGKYDRAPVVVKGLFCLYTDKRVAICNISTREIMDLPPPLATLPKRHDQYSALDYKYYLGFVRARQEYNLLRVRTFRSMCNNGEYETFISKCEILTMGKDTLWRSLETSPIDLCDQSVYLDDGVLCWWYANGKGIVSFCFKNETFYDTCLPPGIASRPPNASFQQFRGHLGLAIEIVDRKVELWVLDVVHFFERGGGKSPNRPPYRWIKHAINIPFAFADRGCWIHGGLPTGELLLSGLEIMSPMPLYSYHPTKATFERFLIDKFPPWPSSQPLTGIQRLELSKICLIYYEENITPLKFLN